MRKASALRRLLPTVLTRRTAVEVGADTGFALLIVLIVYAAVDLVEVNAAVVQDLSDLLLNYLFKLPTVAGLLLPSAAALGLGIRTARLRQRNELLAMASVGISPRAIFLRLMVVPVALTPLTAMLCLYVGPWGIAGFERRLKSAHASAIEACSGVWTRQSFGFVEFGCDGEVRTVFAANDNDEITALYTALPGEDGAPRRNTPRAVWNARDGFQVDADKAAFAFHAIPPHGRPLVNNLFGQSLDWRELGEAIRNTRRLGLSDAALKAERALRIANILACLIVPCVAGAFLFTFRTGRTGRAVLFALASTALFWSLAAAAWNGAATGVLSDVWPAVLAPLGTVGLAAVAVLLGQRVVKSDCP